MMSQITGQSIIFSLNNPPPLASISSKCATAWSFHGQLTMGWIDEQDSAHARCALFQTCEHSADSPATIPLIAMKFALERSAGCNLGRDPCNLGLDCLEEA